MGVAYSSTRVLTDARKTQKKGPRENKVASTNPVQGIPEPACPHPATDATPFVSLRYRAVNTSMMTKRMTDRVAAYPKSRSE